MIVISNTTPISNLLHVEKIFLLTKLFGSIYIPEAVAKEVDVIFLNCGEWRKCIEEKQIIIQSVSNTALLKQMVPFLHQGEAEAICLSLEKKAKLFLIDDKDARTIAQLNNLPVTGTMGILLKAKKSGLISSVKQLIDRLRDEHHFWIREDMYQKVLYIAQEKA